MAVFPRAGTAVDPPGSTLRPPFDVEAKRNGWSGIARSTSGWDRRIVRFVPGELHDSCVVLPRRMCIA